MRKYCKFNVTSKSCKCKFRSEQFGSNAKMKAEDAEQDGEKFEWKVTYTYMWITVHAKNIN